MTATSVAECKGISPAVGKKMLYIQTAATADSGNTLDLTDSDVTGGETLASIDWVVGWDQTSGDVVTVTESSGTVTIDAAGSTTDHVYALLVVGEA